MRYELSVERPGGAEQLVAGEDLAHFAAALDWAGGLLAESADDAARFLRSADGSVQARYVRTAGGQWYAIALPRSDRG